MMILESSECGLAKSRMHCVFDCLRNKQDIREIYEIIILEDKMVTGIRSDQILRMRYSSRRSEYSRERESSNMLHRHVARR